MTPRALTGILLKVLGVKEDDGGSGRQFDKIILAGHAMKNNKGVQGMFLAVGTFPKDLSTDVSWPWGAAYDLESILGEFPEAKSSLDIYTCFTKNIPSEVGGIKITKQGLTDGISRWTDVQSAVIFPWVELECNKNSMEKWKEKSN
jgi:hypothetical protein